MRDHLTRRNPFRVRGSAEVVRHVANAEDDQIRFTVRRVSRVLCRGLSDLPRRTV